MPIAFALLVYASMIVCAASGIEPSRVADLSDAGPLAAQVATDAPSEAASAGACPAEGDCFEVHFNPGCDDETCCNRVCAADPECCRGRWDGLCVDKAEELCGCAGEGNCFEPHATPGCDTESCCSQVCALDAHCCEAEWDCHCVDAATTLCAAAGCPGSGSCFDSHTTPGCLDAVCCNKVCLADPECCGAGGRWDNLCVQKANTLCNSGAAEGPCLTPNGSPGCSDAACASSVCAVAPWCCTNEWDASCASLAAGLCGDAACPGAGACNVNNGTPGCEDDLCCNAVCLEDPICCDERWDNTCAQEAADICTVCPGPGRCDLPNSTPGCEDASCCTSVCAELPLCCMIEWDGVCARAASRLCGHSACPGAGACDVNNGTPGCDDADCCNTVCLHDPICCNERWDTTCTNEAAALCTIPNDPAETAIPITCGEFLSGSTVGATEDVEASLCAAGVTGPGVWYRITGTGGAMTVDACGCGDGADNTVSVLTGACPRALDCIADSGTGPSVSWESQVGQAYFVLVQAAGAVGSEFDLSACCVHPDHTGDRDGDGDTDLSDLAGFMNCYAGPRGPAVAPECSFADLDQDDRIDREDFAEFLCTFEEQ